MSLMEFPFPHLSTMQTGPLHPVEEIILNQVTRIEAWFAKQWQLTPAPITTSVDIRHAGFKLAPVDTNLFPAGFNNLNQEMMPLCVQAAKATLQTAVQKILILPENHTRNRFYFESLSCLGSIFEQAGYEVRFGSLDPMSTSVREFVLASGQTLIIEPLLEQQGRISLEHYVPDLLLLNNDLSDGVPPILRTLQQPIQPAIELGWVSRLKSEHFDFYQQIATLFATHLDFDPWLINPLFCAVDDVDFMQQIGLTEIAQQVDHLLALIREKYLKHQITAEPFAVVKADNGTYGMSVMMVRSGQELLQLNRKQRTAMAATKGSQRLKRVIIQEGIYTFESMPNGAVAEPVVYLIGEHVIGGFYRVHQSRGVDENLNAPGMHFEPLAFVTDCSHPCSQNATELPNRFYVYGVMARLAALAAAHEVAFSRNK